MKYTKEAAVQKSKHGIDLVIYPTDTEGSGLAIINVKGGHWQEFYDKKSTFIYYVIKGEGKFFLDGKETPVKATDVLSIPPKTKIFYYGNMELVLVTTPPWQAANEVRVRYINEREIVS